VVEHPRQATVAGEESVGELIWCRHQREGATCGHHRGGRYVFTGSVGDGRAVVIRWQDDVAPTVTPLPLEPSTASVSEPWSRRLFKEQCCSLSKYRN
jgi:hypothetical protein